VTVSLDRNVFAEGESRGGVLGLLAVGLALLRAVDATQTDAFSVAVVQDFNGVDVEDGDYLTLILRDSGGVAAPKLSAARNNSESRAAILPLQRITPPV
jgi:hypothetical protein